MTELAPDSPQSIRRSVLVGLGLGVGVLCVYLVLGLLFGDWRVRGFVDTLNTGTLGDASIVVASVLTGTAIPVVLYLRHRLLSPLALLVVSTLGWFLYGLLTGRLTGETFFGFTLYLFLLAPLIVALSLLLGAGEYYARTTRSPR